MCGVEVQEGRSGSRPGPRSRPQGETRASQKLFVLEEDRERSICMCGYDMHSATAAGTQQGLRRDYSSVTAGGGCVKVYVVYEAACIFSLKVCQIFLDTHQLFHIKPSEVTSTQAVSQQSWT